MVRHFTGCARTLPAVSLDESDPSVRAVVHGASVRRAARWQPRTIVRKVLARGTLSVKVLRERRCP
jgi:hypothetical protein